MPFFKKTVKFYTLELKGKKVEKKSLEKKYLGSKVTYCAADRSSWLSSRRGWLAPCTASRSACWPMKGGHTGGVGESRGNSSSNRLTWLPRTSGCSYSVAPKQHRSHRTQIRFCVSELGCCIGDAESPSWKTRGAPLENLKEPLSHFIMVRCNFPKHLSFHHPFTKVFCLRCRMHKIVLCSRTDRNVFPHFGRRSPYWLWQSSERLSVPSSHLQWIQSMKKPWRWRKVEGRFM